MKPSLLRYLAALLVGAFHPFFPLFSVTSASSMLKISILSSPHMQEQKMGNLPLVLDSWERLDKRKDRMEIDTKSGVDCNDKYDFIVELIGIFHDMAWNQVGAGTAGGTAADVVIFVPEKYTFSAGKGLGGSANLNFLDSLYEGPFQDYSEWMEATQSPGWGFYMLQPYFKTVKDYMTKKYQISPGESLYYRSTYKALIKPTPNLIVQKYSHVNKVIYDEKDGQSKVRGVELERHGIIKQAFATKEVVISAGTFGSPKILMLSGIGPEALLKSLEITVKADLPVGANFHDHLAVPLGPFFRTSEQYLASDKLEAIKRNFQMLGIPALFSECPLLT